MDTPEHRQRLSSQQSQQVTKRGHYCISVRLTTTHMDADIGLSCDLAKLTYHTIQAQLANHPLACTMPCTHTVKDCLAVLTCDRMTWSTVELFPYHKVQLFDAHHHLNHLYCKPPSIPSGPGFDICQHSMASKQINKKKHLTAHIPLIKAGGRNPPFQYTLWLIARCATCA